MTAKKKSHGTRKRSGKAKKALARLRKEFSGLPGWTRAILGVAAFLLVAMVGVSVALVPDCEDQGCPTLETLQAYSPPEPPHVYDRHGELVGQLPGQRRLVAPLAEVPALVREGFIAVEDRRFREHGGVDVTGILRALARNVKAGDVEEGASTITMQLVRNVFESEVLDYNPWHRKLTEARMALAVEDRLGKDRILELYLNQIYLGGGVYGVETASRYYFGKPVSSVTPGEAALLVGLAKNPEGYNPRRNPDRALARRAVVLGVMEREGLLSADEAAAARDEEIVLAPDPTAGEVRSWYFAAVDRRVRELFPDPVQRRGLRVHTGYDAVLQQSAHDALTRQIEAIEAGSWGRFLGERPSEDDLGPAPGSSPWLQGMAIALDVHTGEVRAVVGGRDFGHSEFDRALQARRQPGSSFKPLVLAAALEARQVTLAARIETTPVVVRQAGSAPWSPKDAQSDGEPLTAREALVRSSNNATVRIGQRIGPRPVVELARRLGMRGELPAYPSVFLGSAEVVPVDLVAAYAAFGNGGMRIVPHLITRIEGRDGTVVWEPDDVAPEAVLDPAAAYLVLDALRSVVDQGTGWRVRQAGFGGPAAGKTGTTDEGKDTWFVGLTPDVAAGVWLGFDEPAPIVAGGGGGTLAAPVWGRMMASAAPSLDRSRPWRAPANVVEVPVDVSTGYRAGEYCPEELVATELFIAGTEPIQQCPDHEGNVLDRIFKGIKDLIRGG